jgi:hypothetical protein
MMRSSLSIVLLSRLMLSVRGANESWSSDIEESSSPCFLTTCDDYAVYEGAADR